MENSIIVVPHPQFLEALFAFKKKISRVFHEVLGLYEIHHLALTYVNNQNQLITFSSTPAMEFNLFNSQLWCFDRTYSPDWFQHSGQSNWQSLYMDARYDELYYTKQVRHGYPIGSSLAIQREGRFFIYSFASQRNCSATQEIFTNTSEDFYKIGHYCVNQLNSLFIHYEQEFAENSEILQFKSST